MAKAKTQIEAKALLFINNNSEDVLVLITIEDGEKTILEDKKFGGKYYVHIKKEKNKCLLIPEYSNSARAYEITDNNAIEKIKNATNFRSKIKNIFS